jgi:putative peptide zinc metalloprotease protein
MTGDQPLLPIRAELRLLGRRHDVSGAEVCVVYDPLRHRFFELAPLAIDILALWPLGSAARIVESLRARGTAADPEDVADLQQFLLGAGLLRVAARPRQRGWFGRLEHAIGQLFFFRIPLLRPDRALSALCEVLAPLFSRPALLVMALVAASGLGLVGRQWDLFLAGFHSAFNTEGLVAFSLAIVTAKAVHELGHALAAKRMGCAVPAMGVAIMFGAPLLYTDLSDSWRLSRRRQRLLVASGGILAETGLAALATWGWLILPDGPARGACFFLMTAAWAATLVLNLNPFMRFDGYFMLSDIMGVPNLQPRSFALGRWALRRLLWGSHEPPPEDFRPPLRRAMLAYAWTTWGVRAGLYLGLAFTVFHLLPKVIALPLLASELWVLLARPVVHEIGVWWSMRLSFWNNRRARITAGLGCALVLFALIPQRFDLALPAVLAPSQRSWVQAPRPALLLSRLDDGAKVSAGQEMAVFQDPELDHQLALSRIRLAMIQAQQEQATTSQRSARDTAVLAEQLAREQATIAGLEAQRAQLSIRAPFDGHIAESARDLMPGSWRAPSDPLFMVVGDGPHVVTAFVNDRELTLVQPDGAARFFAEAAGFPVLDGAVDQVASVPAEAIGEALLSSTNGGPIAADRDSAGRAIPRQGQYQITATIRASDLPPSAGQLVGKLMVESRPHSLADLAFKRLWALVVRETTG